MTSQEFWVPVETVRFRMSDGITFHLSRVTLEHFSDIWGWSLRRNRLIEVENDQGFRRFVNPSQIIYAEEL